jgi:type III secretion protein J
MKRGLWMWMVLLLAGCSTQIQHGLDESQANEMQTALAGRGITAHKVAEQGKKPSWAIEVDDERATEAVRVLSELGLPRARTQGFDEVFGKSSLVPTATEERVKYEEALSGELARTVEGMDGVISARVHLVVPAQPRPGQAPTASKASAFIRVQPSAAERIRHQKADLQALIAGSVEGLSADAVALVIDEATVAPAEPVSAPQPDNRLRALVLGLGGTVSAMGLLLVVLAIRLRRAKAPVPSAKPAASAKPATAANPMKKAA